MRYCSVCGKELRDDDVFCTKCGHSLEEDNPASFMTKEESITLADKLIDGYRVIERLQNEITSDEAIINRPVPPIKLYSAFRFFWKFLIIADIAFSIIYAIGKVMYEYEPVSGLLVMLFSFAVLAGLLIGGGVYSTRKRDSLNAGVYQEDQMKRRNIAELRNKVALLKQQQKNKKEELDRYNDIVPKSFRNAARIGTIKTLLINGKAENFTEAVKIINNY